MKRGIHLKKNRTKIITKDGACVIYNIVQVVKKKKVLSDGVSREQRS